MELSLCLVFALALLLVCALRKSQGMETPPEEGTLVQKLDRQARAALVQYVGAYAAAAAFVGSTSDLPQEYYGALWPVSAAVGTAQDDVFKVSLWRWYLLSCFAASALAEALVPSR